MTTGPDPFEQGQCAARTNVAAEANPHRDGSAEHALWAAGHEKTAGEMEANESEGLETAGRFQPIFFMPFLNRAPLAT